MGKVTALVAFVVCFAAVGAVSADWVMDSVLEGDLGTLDLNCVVTFDGGIYTYTYGLTATGVVNPVHLFDVGNPLFLTYTDAANSGATYTFGNPTYKSFLNSVTWTNGELKFGETAEFVYKTEYAPIEVFTSVSGSGISSDGVTLGMTIPEPGTIVLMAGGLVGMAGLIRRKK